MDIQVLDTSAAKDFLEAFILDLVLQLRFFVAENERQNISRRQAKGIAADRARGVHRGSLRLSLPEDFPALAAHWQDGMLGINELARRCGMSCTSVMVRLREVGMNQYFPQLSAGKNRRQPFDQAKYTWKKPKTGLDHR